MRVAPGGGAGGEDSRLSGSVCACACVCVRVRVWGELWVRRLGSVWVSVGVDTAMCRAGLRG